MAACIQIVIGLSLWIACRATTEIEMCDVNSVFFDETNYTLYHSLKEHNIECCCFLYLGTDTMSLSISSNTSDFVFIFPDGNQKLMIEDEIVDNVQNSTIACATGKYGSPVGQSGAINIVGNKVFKVKCSTYDWFIPPMSTTAHVPPNGSTGFTPAISMETKDVHISTTLAHTSTQITTRQEYTVIGSTLKELATKTTTKTSTKTTTKTTSTSTTTVDVETENDNKILFIIVGSVVVGVLIIGIIIIVCVHRRRERNTYRGRPSLDETYWRHQMVMGDNCLYDHKRGLNKMQNLVRNQTLMGSCHLVEENENDLIIADNCLYSHEEEEERIADSQGQDQCQTSEEHHSMEFYRM